MDDKDQHHYQIDCFEAEASANHNQAADSESMPGQGSQLDNSLDVTCQPKIECSDVEDILAHLRRGHLLMINSRRKSGLILYKSYHAEFAGPGAAVGDFFDENCQQVFPVGDLSLIHPDSHEERQKAYLIRRQWIRLTQQFTDKSMPLQRAQMILEQFENYFDQETVTRIPNEAFAMLVGVLPHTVSLARRAPG